jgi:hypothetical protein
VFMIRRALGVTKATELDGAAICVETGKPSEAAVAAFFKANGMSYEPVASNSESEVVDGYDRNVCDVAVVADSVADTTANGLTPVGAHMILPEKIGGTTVATAPAPRPTAAPTPPPVRRAAPAPAPRRAAPAPAPRRRAAPVAPSEPIALTLQRELKRIGCLTGRVDGIWGRGSRAALDRFAKQARLQLGREPSQVALDEALRTDAGYCKPVRTARRPTRSAAPRRGSGDFDIRDGYDLPGNDYRQLRGKVDYNTCLSTCENDSECLAFTYNTSARACFLKWGGDNWTRFGNAISGMRISGGLSPNWKSRKMGRVLVEPTPVSRHVIRTRIHASPALSPAGTGRTIIILMSAMRNSIAALRLVHSTTASASPSRMAPKSARKAVAQTLPGTVKAA